MKNLTPSVHRIAPGQAEIIPERMETELQEKCSWMEWTNKNSLFLVTKHIPLRSNRLDHDLGHRKRIHLKLLVWVKRK